MGLISKFKEASKRLNKRIVLAEGFDERTIKASIAISDEKMAKVIILGDVDNIAQSLNDNGVDKNNLTNGNIEIINPVKSDKFEKFVADYFAMRESKGMSLQEAESSMKKELFFGAMLVNTGYADGMVAGASNTTSDVLKAGLRVIGVKDGVKTLSSCFIMVTNIKEIGSNGVLLFADSAVNPEPNSEMLADIAISTAESCRQFLNIEPKIAMLSFSTMGSAKTASTEKVVEAVKLLKLKDSTLLVDGEMQLDSAIIPDVGKRKAPGSLVAGHANVLIFPNLDAGNIGYKLVERFSKAEAIGPIIQGLKKPVNDLSRGCSFNDIVNVVAITSVQVR